MAGADNQVLIKPRMRVRKAARLILSRTAEETFACLDAARAGEVEAGIHDMRVAGKQLREGMRLFTDVYRAAQFKQMLARIDTLNDDLGQVRDHDVLLEHLELFSEPTSFLNDLRQVIRAEREAEQERLNVELDALREESFPEKLAAVIDDERHGRGHDVAGQRCKEFARRAISFRLAKVIRRFAAVGGEDDAAGLHRVRVGNKHLRYAIEPFLRVFDRRLKTAYRRVVELHSALGDIHDLDVLTDRLRRFAAERENEAEADELLAEVERHRAREYGRVTAFIDGEGDVTFVRLIADAVD